MLHLFFTAGSHAKQLFVKGRKHVIIGDTLEKAGKIEEWPRRWVKSGEIGARHNSEANLTVWPDHGKSRKLVEFYELSLPTEVRRWCC